MDSSRYCDSLSERAKPEIEKLYPKKDYIFQDDYASFHTSGYTLEKVNQIFTMRLEIEHQSTKNG